jgi:RimJ/RimL family protein N-acetyltransferase
MIADDQPGGPDGQVTESDDSRTVRTMIRDTFTTDRLELRPIAETDAIDLHAVFGDQRVAAQLGRAPLTLAETSLLIAEHIAQLAAVGYAPLAVIERASGRFVGRAGLWYAEMLDAAEVGWVFHPDAHGKGYATEAATAVIDDWNASDRVDALISLIGAGNAASCRVAARLGARSRGFVALNAERTAYAEVWEHPGRPASPRWSRATAEPPGALTLLGRKAAQRLPFRRAA